MHFEQDRNFDGKRDNFFFYKNGELDHGMSDDNFDGREETWYFHNQYGLLARVEIDTNLDNQPEIIEYYTNGVLSEKIWYHETSKAIWEKALFTGGVKKEEYIDNDYDGTFDVKIIYNSAERPIFSVSLR